MLLQIRPSQVQALTELAQRRFVADAELHVRGLELPRWREVGAPVLRAWVRRRIDVGVALGLVEELALLRHLEVAARHDERFADSEDVLGLLHSLPDLQRWPETAELIDLLHAAYVAEATPR
ncbi:MAG TPA: hypothetical protein VGB85_32975 [Nannocystis sp.]|jgi:hypothetical protein